MKIPRSAIATARGIPDIVGERQQLICEYCNEELTKEDGDTLRNDSVLNL